MVAARGADPDGPIADFFRGLGDVAPRVLPTRIQGSVRIDLGRNGVVDHWYVVASRGHVEVSRENREADASLICDQSLFEDLISGREFAVAVLLRNDATLVGSLALFLAFSRFFPSPPGTRDPRLARRDQPAPPIGRPAEAERRS